MREVSSRKPFMTLKDSLVRPGRDRQKTLGTHPTDFIEANKKFQCLPSLFLRESFRSIHYSYPFPLFVYILE
jgi:hypothetical protein